MDSPSSADSDPIVLNAQQQYAVDLVKQGHSIFLTGAAGTGKTLTLSKIIQACEDEGKTIYVTASTGIAASLLSSVAESVRTFHSWASIGLGKYAVQTHVNYIMRNTKTKKRIGSTDVLIVDECSMLDPEFVNKVDDVVRNVRRRLNKKNPKVHQPFGGIQIIFSGDFGQLPPVQRERDTPKYLFQDEIWDTLISRSVKLTKVYRQDDQAFVDLLDRLRDNTLTDADVLTLQSTERNNLRLLSPGIKPTVLFCRNRDVDAMNMSELERLRTPLHVFKAKDYFSDDEAERVFASTFSLPSTISLKVGAQVMLLINESAELGLINGSRGIVEDIDTESESVRVRFSNGIEREYNKHKQECTDETTHKVVAYRMQYPFRLAWCLTIHKSQGMTIDLLDIDLNGTFAAAQAYVAISRGVSLNRMRVRNFTRNCVITSDEVIGFHKTLDSGNGSSMKRKIN